MSAALADGLTTGSPGKSPNSFFKEVYLILKMGFFINTIVLTQIEKNS